MSAAALGALMIVTIIVAAVAFMMFAHIRMYQLKKFFGTPDDNTPDTEGK